MNFTEQDVARLLDAREYITEQLDVLVDCFYRKQTQITEISLLIGDSETLRRLKEAMRHYILELFNGVYDQQYVNRRLRIGKVHKRIGVSPKLYISAMWLLENTLTESIQQAPEEFFDVDIRAYIIKSLSKLLMLDTQFVFDTYFAILVTEVESAKNELSQYAVSLEEAVANRTAELERLSTEDGLTGLKNQRSFYEYLKREVSLAKRNNHPISLALFDVDRFKHVNDSKGHLAGDHLLKHIARVIKNSVRETDLAFRYGGDEFCIIFPNTPRAGAEEMVKRIILGFEKSKGNSDSGFSVGVSSLGPDQYTNYENFMRMADTAIYISKEASKRHPGCHVSYYDRRDDKRIVSVDDLKSKLESQESNSFGTSKSAKDKVNHLR